MADTKSPNSQWQINFAEESSLSAIRSLYREVWGYNRPHSFDHWRYMTQPLGRCPAALADLGDGNLAGAYTIWPVPILVGNRVVRGAQSMDTMTHPQFQGQGIFTKLATACYEHAADNGYEILYGFPNPLSYPGFVKKLGWSHIGDVSHWVRLIDLRGIQQVPTILTPFVNLALTCLPSGSSRNFDISHDRPEDPDLERLLAAWNGGSKACGVHRSLDWLGWRYATDANNDYAWVCAYANGNLAACGVWGMQNENWGEVADKRAHLVELLGTDRSALLAVVSTIIGAAKTRGAVLLETLSNVEHLNLVLKRTGFFRHRKAPFIVRALGRAEPAVDVLTLENWQIFGGDIDTF